jgi:hypothetical protein
MRLPFMEQRVLFTRCSKGLRLLFGAYRRPDGWDQEKLFKPYFVPASGPDRTPEIRYPEEQLQPSAWWVIQILRRVPL